MQPKHFFLEKLEGLITENPSLKILDMGSGRSETFIPILKKYPNITYVGIEPLIKDANFAKEKLSEFGNAKIFNQYGYDHVEGWGEFDVVISLSVLEHVKQLKLFLENSVSAAKNGGRIIHRYDLGHALYPSSIKERIHVFVGNHLSTILPESKFVQYVNKDEVCSVLENAGVRVEKITYHQMPNHKEFLKVFKTETSETENLGKQILEWEFNVSPFLKNIETKKVEKLFPTVCVWCVKK